MPALWAAKTKATLRPYHRTARPCRNYASTQMRAPMTPHKLKITQWRSAQKPNVWLHDLPLYENKTAGPMQITTSQMTTTPAPRSTSKVTQHLHQKIPTNFEPECQRLMPNLDPWVNN